MEDMTEEEMLSDEGFQDFMENFDEQSICHNCSHCIYIGEGDSICDADDEPKIVLGDWSPTDDFWWCAGSEFEED